MDRFLRTAVYLRRILNVLYLVLFPFVIQLNEAGNHAIITVDIPSYTACSCCFVNPKRMRTVMLMMVKATYVQYCRLDFKTDIAVIHLLQPRRAPPHKNYLSIIKRDVFNLLAPLKNSVQTFLLQSQPRSENYYGKPEVQIKKRSQFFFILHSVFYSKIIYFQKIYSVI